MAIFTDEFKQNGEHIRERIRNGFHRDFSNPLHTWWLHLILLVALIFGTRIMATFGVYGINAWWEQYSVLNPNVLIEQTTTYWYFIIADRLLFLAAVIEFCYMGVLTLLWCTEDIKRSEIKYNDIPHPKKIPKCPICKNNMDVIRKGTNVDKSCERFYCKTCGKYFQKKEK